MSMPTFPESGIDLTKEQAFLMLLGSIAMEELALSHIMNAEGEKLQYILGTLPNSHCNPCATTSEVLEVNRSISDLLERVAQNQLLLKGKLTQVLEAMENCLPCEPKPIPPKPPCCHCTNSCVLCCKDFCWHINSPLPLKPVYHGNSCFNWWHKDTPMYIYLPQNKPVLFNYRFSLCDCECRNISFSIETLKNGIWDEICSIDTNNLSGSTIVIPDTYRQGFSPIAIFLKNPCNITIKTVYISLTEL